MNKEKYAAPQIELIVLKSVDIITLSDPGDTDEAEA